MKLKVRSHEDLLDLYDQAKTPLDKSALRGVILMRMQAGDPAVCADCGQEIPQGNGIGVSAPDAQWTDRTKSRPIEITPLCVSCTMERVRR